MIFLSTDSITLHQGEALAILKDIPDASVDAVVTDPPYSSGGLMRSDRTSQNTSSKYVMSGTGIKRSEFTGDNRDQRGYGYWSALWLSECLRITRPGGCLLCFTDWRQLPTLTDAIQAGGWVWRGIVPWDKTEASKPQRGWYRHQCEYVLTAANGSMGNEQERAVSVCAPGCIRKAVNSAEKYHIAGKPVEVMQALMQILPPKATVLDPFAGSGSTLIAARNLGHTAIGIEMLASNCEIVQSRLAQAILSY
ncbi:MAG: site-specific DNA-methyltransferase [Verrucomicrobiota bacterium]|nr:site-specific DNA-methyltransferase [Verrucomicrobiota bacterium]